MIQLHKIDERVMLPHGLCYIIFYKWEGRIAMLKRYSLCAALLAAVYACSAYESDDATDRFISNMARKLHFSGLVPGTHYQYKIIRNPTYRAVEISDESLYQYYGTCSIFLYNSPASYPAYTYIVQNGQEEQYSINVEVKIFKLLLNFYHAMPVKEVFEDYYLPTYFKSGTFTYQE